MNQAMRVYERDLRNQQRKIRRRREVRRIFILAGIAIVLALAFAFSYHAFLSNANTELGDISYKYYTSIQIAPGDTLWSLADKYADKAHYSSQNQYIAEVMSINHLTGQEIYSGNYLILPYYSSEYVK
ncbi:MAG: LysM peptidoglycan-binding domain-containing protein [Lachnospiraceae bacterium]|nr:LysM peptidoglycan-binding domain-containing protein [Lachnospiraceae bacterium]